MLSSLLLSTLPYFLPILSLHVPILPHPNYINPATPPASSPPQFSPSNTTTPINARLAVYCDSHLGRNLKVKSCRDLFGYLSPAEEQYTFSERDSGINRDVGLPLRTYSNDALCYLQPSLVPNAIVGHAAPQQIYQAGVQILQSCVIERGMGGFAKNLGGDNKMEVALAKYEPDIKCDTSPTPGPPWPSCVVLFGNMRAGTRRRVFGGFHMTGIDEELPYVLETEDGRCEVLIDIAEHTSTTATWYEIWSAISALASVCARWKGKGGRVKGLGANKSIYVELSDKATSPRLFGAARVAHVTSITGGNGTKLATLEQGASSGTLREVKPPMPFTLVTLGSSLADLPGFNTSDLTSV